MRLEVLDWDREVRLEEAPLSSSNRAPSNSSNSSSSNFPPLNFSISTPIDLPLRQPLSSLPQATPSAEIDKSSNSKTECQPLPPSSSLLLQETPFVRQLPILLYPMEEFSAKISPAVDVLEQTPPASEEVSEAQDQLDPSASRCGLAELLAGEVEVRLLVVGLEALGAVIVRLLMEALVGVEEDSSGDGLEWVEGRGAMRVMGLVGLVEGGVSGVEVGV